MFYRVLEVFQPSAFVVQCGADALREDPVGECNLIIETYETCLINVLQQNLPTILLGGGICRKTLHYFYSYC